MSQRTISQQAIFVEREGWVYYVTNWQKRFAEGGRAKLVRLSPRHFVRYNDLKAKGRSQKTIAMLLFKRVEMKAIGVKAAAAKVKTMPMPAVHHDDPVFTDSGKREDSRTVTVDINMLTHEQLLALLQRLLRERLPGLRAMPVTELRRMYMAVLALKGVA